MITIPKLALVGRANVGKSTLFNRISGQRKAIIDSRPGSTRDRNYAQGSWRGAAFEVIDTGGLLLQTDDPLLGPAADQAERAIVEAELVLLVVDGRAGLMPDDQAIAAQLRKSGKRVVVAVNKAEPHFEGFDEFSALGFDSVVAISAEHGQGVGDLLDAAVEHLPRVEAVEEESRPVRMALVGRPNVGKSSLLNRLLGSERAVVSDVPGTTRDAVDSLLVKEGKRYLFVDTAGIRRSRHLKENVDHVSVVQSKKAIDRADVAVVVLDATEGLREMDATIAGYVQKAGRAVILAVNKWDAATENKLSRKAFEQDVRDHLKFLPYAPVLFLSAKTGAGTGKLLPAVEEAHASSRQRISTGQLNRVIGDIVKAYPPKAASGNHTLKVLFATQVGVAPPTFLLSVNHPVDLHFSYKRYLENQIRKAFGFEGTPINIKVKTRPH